MNLKNIQKMSSHLNKKIMIPELEFVKFINLKNTYRNPQLLKYAQELMIPLQDNNID